MIKIKNKKILNIPCHIGRIHAIAYDGCEFSLLTQNQKGIVKLDQQLCPIKTIPTCRKYQHLCFCQQNQTYWAMCEQQPCTLFMLDENFCEMDAIKLPSKSPRRPYAISCTPSSNELLILYANAIAHVDISNQAYLLTPMNDERMRAFDILSLRQGYVLAYIQNHRFFIEMNSCDCGEACRFCIPDGFYLEGMYECSSCQTSPDCFIYEINLLLCDSKNHEQYILPLQITCCKESCVCEETPPSCHQGVNEILHSIALEETGLAHILNAEGEKIQKAIKGDITIDELLQVNDSVSNTISKITILEVQLIAKLESVLCFCDDIDDECFPEPPCDVCSLDD